MGACVCALIWLMEFGRTLGIVTFDDLYCNYSQKLFSLECSVCDYYLALSTRNLFRKS